MSTATVTVEPTPASLEQITNTAATVTVLMNKVGETIHYNGSTPVADSRDQGLYIQTDSGVVLITPNGELREVSGMPSLNAGIVETTSPPASMVGSEGVLVANPIFADTLTALQNLEGVLRAEVGNKHGLPPVDYNRLREDLSN